ncbi:hypothetical protein [Fibrisoma montanum]|nr:hypothetical protein [Fibrisoma montanum]
MRVFLFLFSFSLLVACQPDSEPTFSLDSLPTPASSTILTPGTEMLDANAPTSSTLIKTMVVQSTYKDTKTEGYRYEYQYSYDAGNRLVKLEFNGYLHKDVTSSTPSYANLQRRIATLDYNGSGELSALHMVDYGRTGNVQLSLTFPVRKENGDLVVYGLPQWYPNPFADQPILRITPAGQLTQLPTPWNAYPNVQFALNTFNYDVEGNLKAVTFSYVEPSYINAKQEKKQASLLQQITHTQQVRNPFGTNPAYAAAHFLIRGGFEFTVISWLDIGKKLPLNSTLTFYSREESGPGYVKGSNVQSSYDYIFNGNNLPIRLRRVQRSTGSTDYIDNFTFTY